MADYRIGVTRLDLPDFVPGIGVAGRSGKGVIPDFAEKTPAY
jgi:hypothetical protein